MSLEDKFTELQELLVSQHDALIAALATPPAPAESSPADILAILSSIQASSNTVAARSTMMNSTLNFVRSENAASSTAIQGLLSAINTNTDTIISNSSLNAQLILAALYATFCECETETPLLAPPIDVTPTILIDEAKCRRIQFYLSIFGNWLNAIANYGASGAAITGGVLATLLNGVIATAGIVATGAEVGAVGGPPGIVIGAVVALLTVAVYTLGGSVLIDYAAQFNDVTLRENMVLAMYAAENADEGYTAFKTTLLASMDTIPAEIIYTLWWTAWSNDVYSGSPEVDDSAFDGSMCVPVEEGCTTLVEDSFSSTEPTFYVDETWTGYDYYHVKIFNATGNVNSSVYIGGVHQGNPYGPLETYWTTAESFRFVCSSYFPGSCDILVEGCMGTAP